ncbi:MAG TPA: hypothetical protein VM779_06215 [Thermoanaerobaculia bacterium]|nr:hypothetical protein [Thermoanaerobaculia bacterium]
MTLIAAILTATSGITTYCNPIDLDYQYDFQHMNAGISYLAAADPRLLALD